MGNADARPGKMGESVFPIMRKAVVCHGDRSVAEGRLRQLLRGAAADRAGCIKAAVSESCVRFPNSEVVQASNGPRVRGRLEGSASPWGFAGSPVKGGSEGGIQGANRVCRVWCRHEGITVTRDLNAGAQALRPGTARASRHRAGLCLIM